MSSRVPRIVWAAALLAAAFSAAAVEAATRYDSRLRFRTLATSHFTIYYHQGEQALARRLAVVAEQVHEILTTRLATRPRGRTHVVLVDQDDAANGLSTTTPYNFIEIVAGPPGRSELIGNTDDWLRLVFTHEYAHVLNVGRVSSAAAAARRVFGAAPFVFPNYFQPLFQVEGVATYAETAVAGRGRLEAGDFRAVVAEPARLGRADPLDRASGGLVPWPSGIAPYAYGGFFYRYLTERYGEPRVVQFAERTSRGYYFLPGPAFSKVFGQPLAAAWRDFQRTLPRPDGVSSAALPPRRLTTHGFQIGSPRFLPQGIVYSLHTAQDFPSLMVVAADGSAEPMRLADQYGTTRLSGNGQTLVFDQLEASRSVALRSDLYTLDFGTRRVRRLTEDGRLAEPDLSPDGRSVACVRLIDGVRTLAVYARAALEGATGHALPEPVLEVQETDTQFGSPRWSPDGRLLAAERWPLNGRPEIVVIDAATGQMSSVAATAQGRDVSPAWWPDGSLIVFASDRAGGDFGVYAVEIRRPGAEPAELAQAGTLYRVASVPGGMLSPDVSPDGRTIAFVGYTPSGYDLFTIPANRDGWTFVSAAAENTTPAPEARIPSPVAPDPAPDAGYSPLGTLAPRYWLPQVRTEDGYVKVGLAAVGTDVLGRHTIQADVVWRVSGGVRDERRRERPDWSVSYVYDRWRPVFFASASDKLRFVAGPGSPEGEAGPPAEVRKTNVEIGLQLPVVRVRRSQTWLASVAFERQTLKAGQVSRDANRHGIRLGYAFSNAKLYGYSISREQGLSIGLTGEFVRRALGADGNADALTAEIRAYPRAGGSHRVLSLRAGIGTSRGDDIVRRQFHLGGSEASTSLLDFGSGALSMLRGFEDDSFWGRHIAVASVDYRRPLFRLDRGLSWWPLMLRVVHGALFVDAGNVWSQQFSISESKGSAGAEVSADLVLGYTLPLTVTLGGAWTRDGAARPRGGSGFYVRVGRAF